MVSALPQEVRNFAYQFLYNLKNVQFKNDTGPFTARCFELEPNQSGGSIIELASPFRFMA